MCYGLKLFDKLKKKEIEEIKKEMISKVDRETLSKLFEYATRYYNQRFRTEKEVHPNAIDFYLDYWASSKYILYLFFGRNLILRKPTVFRFDEDFIEKVKSLFEIEHMKRRVNGEEIVIDVSHFKYYIPIIMLFNEGDIQKNVCVDDDNIKELLSPFYKPGQKLSRFFSKFFDDENFDIQYSKIFQNRFNDQYINMSIDPIDFLTVGMSNTFGGSCYNLNEFYQGAGFSFMCDKTSVMVFLSKGEKEKSRYLDVEIYNKINRAVMDVREDFEQFSFNGIVVESLKQQVDEYMNWIKEILESFNPEGYSSKFEENEATIPLYRCFNHICDNEGPLFIMEGSNIKQVTPGRVTLYSLSNPKKEIESYKNKENGWMFE